MIRTADGNVFHLHVRDIIYVHMYYAIVQILLTQSSHTTLFMKLYASPLTLIIVKTIKTLYLVLSHQKHFMLPTILYFNCHLVISSVIYKIFFFQLDVGGQEKSNE
ncbi:hypothetical protein ACJX0J_017926, partial [Zea mays]